MKKSSILIGFIAAIVALIYFSPQELMQVSIQTALEETESAKDSDIEIPPTLPEEGAVVEPEEELPPAAATDETKFLFKSYMIQAKFFERAFKFAKESGDFEGALDDKAYAGILPHHLIHSDFIAGYFAKLAATQDISTFIVIGPNHFDRGEESIAVSKYGYSTPYGELEVNSDIVNALLDGDYAGWDAGAFDEEHSISSLVPYIKRNFPNAKIVPITLKYRNLDENLDELVADLTELLGPNDFVLGSIDFSHYMWQNVADFHDELSRTVIETFDFDQIDELEIDSRPSLYTVMRYAESIGAEKAEIVAHTNSADKVGGKDWIDKTTSHFYIAFEEGDPSDERAVTVMALGDIMMGRYVRTLMEMENNNERSFELIRGDEDRFFYGADVFFGNLEGPIQGAGFPSRTSLIFGFHEDTAPLLSKFGFDVFSIANNHILNQGWDGFDSTVQNLQSAGVSACGHPTEVVPGAVVYKTFGDKEIAFICFDDVGHRLDMDSAVSLVDDVDDDVDFTIVSIHWGFEYVHTPNNYRQVDPAHRFVDAGADVIIGHHPHVVQTFEIYNGVPIFYSLGNFIFDQYWSYDTQEQLGVGIVLGDETTKFYLFPMHSDQSRPYLMNKEEKEHFYDRFISWGGYDEAMQAQIRSSVVEIQR
ncbi:MAG: AmmeMemoRadiSam system protein B [Candidatus Gracilibacteria bacterium]